MHTKELRGHAKRGHTFQLDHEHVVFGLKNLVYWNMDIWHVDWPRSQAPPPSFLYML